MLLVDLQDQVFYERKLLNSDIRKLILWEKFFEKRLELL